MAEQAEIRIDAADGSVHVGALVFSARMPMKQVRQTAGEQLTGERDIGNGYVWLSVSGVRFGGAQAGMSLCFFHGKLEMILLGVALPGEQLIEGWPTETEIQRQVAFMKKIFEHQLQVALDESGCASFPWGSAWSRFDIKGFMASGGVAYGR